MSTRESLLDRFIRYVKIDTQSSDSSTTYPSTEKQKDLLRVLVDDLKAAGLEDAAMDEWGYVMATLPSNVPHRHPAYRQVPTIGLIAHVDTYFGVTGAHVQPQVHGNYDGRDIVLPGDPSLVIRVADEPELAACQGCTIITTDGTTLLGADDKAGVAVILEVAVAVARTPGAAARAHPGRLHAGRRSRPRHGTLRRQGVRRRLRLHHRRFGARLARSRDVLRRHGRRHRRRARTSIPGYAKNKMVNAVRVVTGAAAGPAAAPHAGNHRRPRGLPPPDLGLRQHVGGAELAAGAVVLRRRPARTGGRPPRDTAAFMEKRYPGAQVQVEIKPSYRNMRYKLDEVPHVVEYADEAVRRAGVTPHAAAGAGRHGRFAPVVHGIADAQHLQRVDELPRQEGVGAARVDGQVRRVGGQPAGDLGGAQRALAT